MRPPASLRLGLARISNSLHHAKANDLRPRDGIVTILGDWRLSLPTGPDDPIPKLRPEPCSARSLSQRQMPSRLPMLKRGLHDMPDFREKFKNWGKVIVGGPMGVFAWGISGASAVAIFVWGLNTVALPLIMLKTASWGIWGFGVLRESKTQIDAAKKPKQPPPPRLDG